jgi:hypothetical protein
MREYYARFFREVWRQVFAFWKSQVVVSLGAGIVAAVVNAIRQETPTPTSVVLWSVGIAAIGYLAMLGIFSICAVMIAPVKLDQQREREIQQQKNYGETEIATHREDARQQYFGRVKAEAELQQERARKHPHDEHLEAAVSEALNKLTEAERRFVRWLLDAHRAGNAQIFSAGFRNLEPVSIINRPIGIQLLTYEDYCPGNGLIPMDRFYMINPTLVTALKNVLHPSP